MKKKVLSFAVVMSMLLAFFTVNVFAGQAEVDAVLAALKDAGVTGSEYAAAADYLGKNAADITKDKADIIVKDVKAAKTVAGSVTDASKLTEKQRGEIIKLAQEAAAAAGVELRIDGAANQAAVFAKDGSEIYRVHNNGGTATAATTSVVKATGATVDFTNLIVISVALAGLFGGAVVLGRKKSGAQA